ncbi:MAG: methyl-accepting chemotaxis protein, partial [Phycisphaerales bacterium]
NALATISAIAENKAARLDAYARERLRSVGSIASGLAFIGAAQDLGAAYRPDGSRDEAAYAAALAKYRNRLDDFARVAEFPRFLIIDASGRVVYALGADHLLHRKVDDAALASMGLAAAIGKVRTERKALVSPSQVARDDARPSVEVVGPLLKDGEIAGFAAVERAPTEIDEFVCDYAGLGKTGSVLCAIRIGSEVVVTTPTRDDADAAFRLRGKMGSEFSPKLQEVVLGNSFRGRGTDTDGHEVVGAWTRIEALGWSIAVTQHLDEVLEASHAQRRAAAVVAAVAFVPVLVVALLVARSISRPIAVAAGAAERLAQGDLAQPVEVTGTGESKAMLRSMRHAIESLVALLGRVRDSGVALGATAAQLRRGAEEQAEIAQQFGASSTESAAAGREITSTQQELSVSMQSGAGAARDASESARTGRTSLGQLDDGMRSLLDGSTAVAARLDAIRERAARINDVVASMAKVANQTNLLSVNAAMEAERAGEAGAGFRAVAREIRRLSEQTAEATLAIESIVREMQAAVAEGVADMSKYGETVAGGARTSSDVSDGLRRIIDSVERLEREIDLVARGMEAQALGASQVASAIDALTDGATRAAAGAAQSTSSSAELESRAESFANEVAAFPLPNG